MPPSPDDGTPHAGPVGRRYRRAEESLLRRIASALASAGGDIARALAHLGPLRALGRRLLARLEAENKHEIPRLIVEAYQAGAEQAARETDAARRRERQGQPGDDYGLPDTPPGTTRPPTPPGRDRSPLPGPPDELVRNLLARLHGEVHPQVLRSVDDAYRRVIAETYTPVLTGDLTRLQASQHALDRLAAQGVSGFVDRAGRNWNLATYVEMAMRTATQRAAIAGALDRYRADGIDLAFVPRIPHGCPVCAPFEGRILALRDGVPAPRGVTLAGTVTQAMAAGLFHANCRHNLAPWVRGVHIDRADYDPQGYKDRQRQRELERRVRRARLREAVAVTDTARTAARQDIRRRQKDIRDFLATHPEQRRQARREQLIGVYDLPSGRHVRAI
ncbi:phage minor capsid protein [Parafrankia sp. EUN1f]|uniref:phage minor capsid protein n=1 Tax=Parafrankia sp. EUN1f TaxID=102897 RepID=UPI0001C46CD8|nr:phage minor capsid protein [Parafrankia sp. EUN1f]EFC80235.1 hypothetical protein FrEUN1fDRAFT_6629 [Parafrankia sp. EUN1f]